MDTVELLQLEDATNSNLRRAKTISTISAIGFDMIYI